MSLVEVLVVIGIIAALAAVLLPVVTKLQNNSQSVRCLSQLHQIALAFQLYAQDNDGTYPDPSMTGKSWEQALARILPDSQALKCPGDEEIFPVIGSSYDWRDTGLDTTTLAGRTMRGITRSNPVLVYDALPGWHVRKMMNAARLDGTACSMDEEACIGDIRQPIR